MYLIHLRTGVQINTIDKSGCSRLSLHFRFIIYFKSNYWLFWYWRWTVNTIRNIVWPEFFSPLKIYNLKIFGSKLTCYELVLVPTTILSVVITTQTIFALLLIISFWIILIAGQFWIHLFLQLWIEHTFRIVFW